jgi:hypothetical protein
MTFKHIAFNESETMRELSRIAIDKKMIKPSAPIIKEASAPDYSVSTSLTQNILKLCSGLRANGLSKYADEVESKFITYKKAAQECYNVSGEEGTDLVNAAHPEGSHQLVDVPGDSLVETIIDRQLADLKTIDKEPKGKLGTTKDIIKEVKRALGQQKTDQEQLEEQKDLCNRNLSKAISGYTDLSNRANSYINTLSVFSFDPYITYTMTKDHSNYSWETPKSLIISFLNDATYLFSALQKSASDFYEENESKINNVKSYITNAIKNKANIIALNNRTQAVKENEEWSGEKKQDQPQTTSQSKGKMPLLDGQYATINGFIGTINAWIPRASAYPKISSWLSGEKSKLEKLIADYKTQEADPRANINELRSGLISEIQRHGGYLNKFQVNFIDSKKI